MKTFIDLVVEKYSHLRQFYNTDQEFVDHLLSGEVTMPIKDAIDIHNEILNQELVQ